MTRMNLKVDGFFRGLKKWQKELKELRRIILGHELTEELKWGVPCYTLEKRNVVLIHAFKEYCAILFVKGALLKDAQGILIQQTKNTQAARQIRFTTAQEIRKLKSSLNTYLLAAIAVEKAGLKVKFKKITEHAIPDELQHKLDAMPALKTAFGALTPGRQRAYLLHVSAAKRSTTRESRVEKCIPRILKGKGLDD